MYLPPCIRLAVELAVVGALYVGGVFIHLRQLVALKLRLEHRYHLLERGLPGLAHHEKQLQGLAPCGVDGWDADAVGHSLHRHCRVLNLRGGNLVATDVYHVAVAALQTNPSCLVKAAYVVGEDRSVVEYLTRSRLVADVTAHQSAARAHYGARRGYAHAAVLHRAAQTARPAEVVVVVVCGYDAGLCRRVGVVEAAAGEQSAELLHVGLRHRCGPRLDEVDLAGEMPEPLPAQRHEQSYVGRHQEACHLLVCPRHRIIESVDVSQSAGDAQRAALGYYGGNLRQTADVVKRSAEQEREVLTELLRLYKVLSVCHNGPVANHNPLGLARCPGGEEYVVNLFGDGIALGEALNLAERLLWRVALERHGNAACHVDGEVADDEVGAQR